MAFVALAIGVGAAAGSAYLDYNAQQKGVAAQQAALNSVQGANIPAIENLASQTDLQKYQEQFQAEANVDPNYAALRNQGASSVLGVLADLSNPNGTQNLAYKNAAAATNAASSATSPVIQDLLKQARSELASGATLPPSFQAELIRSGLAAGGAAGTGVSGEGATGVGARTLLGSAGIQLQQQRQQQAEALTGAATGAASQQEAALNELTKLAASLNAQKASIGAGAAGMGTAALPSIGITGSEAANLSTKNTDLANQKAINSGQLAAQSAANQGTLYSGILGDLTGGLAGWLGNLTATPSSTPSSTAALTAGGIPTNPGYTGLGYSGTSSLLTPSTNFSGSNILSGLNIPQ